MDATRKILAALESLDRFLEDPRTQALPSDAVVTMGSRMAARQITVFDLRVLHAALKDARENSPGHEFVLAGALEPILAFTGGGGFSCTPDDIPITTDRLRRRLHIRDFRLLREIADDIENL